MSDIVEQAARVLNSLATSWGAPGDWEMWREEAQALADAGLLARPTPTREEITDIAMSAGPTSARAAVRIADAVLELLAGDQK